MDRELEKIPGVLWNFSQPIADNMEEAVSGVKGELAVKIYGDDLQHAGSTRAMRSSNVMRTSQGHRRIWACSACIGQPNLNFAVDREAAARYQINVADVQDAIQTAVGGNAVSQVLQGEQRYDLVLRYLPQYRNTKEAIENIRLLSPRRASAFRWRSSATCRCVDGASEIYREGELALCRDQVQRARPRSGQHGGRGDRQGGQAGETARGLSHRLGRRV